MQCYCCGQLLTERVALVTLQDDSTDRVFLFEPEHAKRADGASYEVVTREGPWPKKVR